MRNLLFLTTIVFVILKLIEVVTWSWVIVLSPLILAFVLTLIMAIIGYFMMRGQQQAMEKLFSNIKEFKRF